MGQYTKYYVRIGKNKEKKYKCIFENCHHRPLPSRSGICSHLERTHGEEIEEIEIEEQREIEYEKKREKEYEENLKWLKKNAPKLKAQRALEEKRREEQARAEEEQKQREIKRENERVRLYKKDLAEQRRREEARAIEIWFKIQNANDERERKKEEMKMFLDNLTKISLFNQRVNLIKFQQQKEKEKREEDLIEFYLCNQLLNSN